METTDTVSTMGAYLKERRLQLGMTQEEVAELVGTSGAYLSQIERGKVQITGTDLRRRLASALRLRHVDLLVAAGELAANEVPGEPTQFDLGSLDAAEQLCQQLRLIDLTRDRRRETLRGLFEMFLAQDRQRGRIAEPPASETAGG